MKNNIAVVGVGYWGKNLVRNFASLGVLNSICDNDTLKMDAIQERFPDLDVFSDYHQLLKDPDIKGVAISTPASTHFQIVKDALLSKKDVFVEKPLAMTTHEGKELVSVAEKNGNILMVGHILEYHPCILRLKEFINTGELGNIKYIYSNRLNLGKFRREENILWSFAPHDISVILSLIGEMPYEVSVNGANFLDPEIADTTLTAMAFQGGVKAHIFVSWLHPYKEQKLVVVGGKKMIVFDNVNSKGCLSVYDHKIEWIDRNPIALPMDAQNIEVGGTEPLFLECEHFIECIESRKTPETDGYSGLSVLEILEACQKSLKKSGSPIKIGKDGEKDYFVHPTSIFCAPPPWGSEETYRSLEPAARRSVFDIRSAKDSVEHVLTYAGARPADRDSVDIRIVDDVRNGTGTIINSQNEVGGWPRLAEKHKTLRIPNDPHGDLDGDGYTNLEEMLYGYKLLVEGLLQNKASKVMR